MRLSQVRVNTKLVYNQQKFNLLREARRVLWACVSAHSARPDLCCRQESEGFSKVLTVLNNAGASALNEADVKDVVRTLQSLIGCFDLDPNRVFDLVLDRCASSVLNHVPRHCAQRREAKMRSCAFLIPSGSAALARDSNTMDRLV